MGVSSRPSARRSGRENRLSAALRARIEQHIEETRQQAVRIRGCIDRLGGDTSAVKDMTAKMMAMAQGLSGMFVSDEVVKASLASYAFEHMEIASY